MNDKIEQLRQELKKHKIDAYIIPSNDEFHTQYSRNGLLARVTGFTGSAGTAVITRTECYLFTDGRYIEQAAGELDKSSHVMNIRETPLETWLASFINQGNSLGFDPKLHAINQINSLSAKLKDKDAVVSIPSPSVILASLRIQEHKTPRRGPFSSSTKVVGTPSGNHLFLDPQRSEDDGSEKNDSYGTISIHKLKYAGQSTEDKQKVLITHLKQKHLDGIIINDATSICWLLNVRAYDILFSPCITAYLIAYSSGKIELFTSSRADSYLHDNNVTVLKLDSFDQALEKLKDKKLQLSGQAPFFFTQKLKNYVLGEDPCLLPKACKNKVELQGAMKAGVKDNKALTNFFNWLYKELPRTKLTELDLVDKLVEFRKQQKNFLSPSFPSIVGFNSNAAIIHYHPAPASNKKITGNGILLIDSGSQYLEGTTDITRTIAIGKPTKAQIHDFTLVLKGHINLITAVFPQGTSGSQLDTLAHVALWKEGKDYDHGTGHGVGSVLNVHEGPQNISRASLVPLREGMIVSVEPGFYKPNHYGIRIENLAYIKKAEFPGYLTFEALTYVPIDLKLVDLDLLTKDEASWLKNYNKKCDEIFNHT